MSKSEDKFTKRLVTLLLIQREKAASGGLKLKHGIGGLKSIGEILVSDNYIKQKVG